MIKENKLAKVYEVRNNGEYGTFVLLYEESYLEVICNTSFGVYAHVWSSPGKSAYDFLVNMPYRTFIYKMSNGKQKVIDNDGQEKIMCSLIDDVATVRGWSEEEVQDYKDLAYEVSHAGIRGSEEFKSYLVSSEIFEPLYENDYEAIEVVEKDNPQLEGLWNQLWIPLLKQVKEDNIGKNKEVETN